MKYLKEYKIFEGVQMSEEEWAKRILELIAIYRKMFAKNDNEWISRSILKFSETAKKLKINLNLLRMIISGEFDRDKANFKLKFPYVDPTKEDAIFYYNEFMTYQRKLAKKRKDNMSPEEKQRVNDIRNESRKKQWAEDPEWREKIKAKYKKVRDKINDDPVLLAKYRELARKRYHDKRKNNPEWWEVEKVKAKERERNKRKKQKAIKNVYDYMNHYRTFFIKRNNGGVLRAQMYFKETREKFKLSIKFADYIGQYLFKQQILIASGYSVKGRKKMMFSLKDPKEKITIELCERLWKEMNDKKTLNAFLKKHPEVKDETDNRIIQTVLDSYKKQSEDVLNFMDYYYKLFDRISTKKIVKKVMNFVKVSNKFNIPIKLRKIIIEHEFEEDGKYIKLKNPDTKLSKEKAIKYYKEFINTK